MKSGLQADGNQTTDGYQTTSGIETTCGNMTDEVKAEAVGTVMGNYSTWDELSMTYHLHFYFSLLS